MQGPYELNQYSQFSMKIGMFSICFTNYAYEL